MTVAPLSMVSALLVAGLGCTSSSIGGGREDSGTVDGGAVDAAVSNDGPPGQPDASLQTPCPDLPLGGEVREWEDVMGSAWPLGTSNVTNIVVPDPGYLSLRFETGDDTGTGRITDIENTTAAGVRTGTISTCQGDFRTDLPTECRHTWGIGGAIRWSTEASPDVSDCALKPNTVYFFNTTFMADPYDENSSTCNSVLTPPVCSITLNHTSF